MTSQSGRTTVSPARRTAIDILQRVEAGRAFASVLIAGIPESSLTHRDRALAQELVLGVLRWQKALDYFIERYGERPLEDLDLPVLMALRLGIYQLRYLSRIPASAAVNESVNLVRRARLAGAGGLVNAVLRRAARSLADAPGEGISDSLEKLAVEVSHPAWMLERWANAFGSAEAASLALANNKAPQTAFRINPLLSGSNQALLGLQQNGVKSRPSVIAPGAFVAEHAAALGSSDAARRGWIYIQDEASQLVSLALRVEPGQRVLDLCAAPGSKTSHIAAIAGGDAMIVACDLHLHRLATLNSICSKLGASRVSALALDGTRTLPFLVRAAKFDRVLVDAPCTGTGTLRENPEIKWRLRPDDVTRIARTQLELLKQGAEVLETGARLVYSTCSIEAEENERVLEEFLEGGAPFKIVKPEVSADLMTADGFIRTFPHRHGCDGFFAAVLERR
jgi:16S rRNA (cytosine967-C5)-methyltransferase